MTDPTTATGTPFSHAVPYRARFDECGPDGVLRASGFMRWAQDCAWQHSERLGFTRAWYAERGLWWIVRCAELNVLADVRMGETVTVTTSVVGWRKVWARRRTEFAAADGSRVAAALTDWVITDSRGAPTRVPAEFGQIFGSIVTTFTPGRVLLPPTPAEAALRELVVRPADVDPMAHANNAAYLDWFDECLAAGGASVAPLQPDRVPRRYRLEYIAPTESGDRLTAATWRLGSGSAHRLTGLASEEVLRATFDAATDHDDFRELVARRAWRAPGKSLSPG
jgi:acyl-CoA thioester hydrolase